MCLRHASRVVITKNVRCMEQWYLGFMITLRVYSIPHHVAHRPKTVIGQTYVSLPVHLSAHAGCGNVKYLGSVRGLGLGFGV